MHFSAILFDLDGTLTDSLPLINHTYEKVFGELGVVWQPEAVMDMIGLPLRQIARTFAGDKEQDFLTLYQRYYMQDHDLWMRTFPWTAKILTGLKEVGLRLGVVTSKGRAGTERTMEFTGLRDAFEVVVVAEDTPTHKPEPGPVLYALEGMGVDAGAAAYVGDSPYDILAGRAAGTFTAGVTWGAATGERLAGSEPSIVFSDWRRLTDFFRERADHSSAKL